MRIRILLLTTLLTAVAYQGALACGDSLYRVGKGTPYRTYTTPLPGNLLVYVSSEEDARLANMLADSGHTVHVVKIADNMQAELQHGSYDVVIAPFGQRDAVAAIAASNAAYLPVAMSRSEEKLAKEQFKAVLSSDDDIKRFLKTIHKTLKTRA